MSRFTENISRFFLNRRNIFILGFVLTFVLTLLEVSHGKQYNFFTFQNGTFDFWKGEDPYGVEKYDFLYGPLFAILFAPFAYLGHDGRPVRMEPVQLLDVLLRHFHAAPAYGESEMPDLPLHGDDPRDDADVDAVQPGSSLPVPVRLHAAGARETFLGDHADPDLRVLQDIRHFRTGAVAVLPEVLA